MIAAIGAFDGFHLGHQALLRTAADRARETGKSWGIVTFDRRPGSLLSFKGVKTLFTSDEQAILETYFSVPAVRRIDFGPRIAGMKPAAFLDYIGEAFGVDGIAVGDDFRFGKDRAGTPDILSAECRRRGWSVDVIPIQTTEGGVPICSSTVREAVARGDMGFAADLLGYPFFCKSRVVHGNARGRRLGFPTANLAIPPEKVDLRCGVYATLVRVDDDWYGGAANVGYNPTFRDVPDRRFEVNLLGYQGNLYDRTILVLILRHIRDEIRFESAQELEAQMGSDIRAVEAISAAAIKEKTSILTCFAEAERSRDLGAPPRTPPGDYSPLDP